MIQSDACRLSVVVGARNDDHGGDFLKRFRLFAENLLYLAGKWKLSGELVVVDWNTPEGKPSLHDATALDSVPAHFPVRFIRVSPSVHGRFPHSREIPFYQMIAKNVGIRRARGEFILATCADIVFSGELIRYLAEGALDPNAAYRVDRLDVPSDAPFSLAIPDFLAWCAGNVIRRNGRFRVVHLNDAESASKPPGERAVGRARSGLRGMGYLLDLLEAFLSRGLRLAFRLARLALGIPIPHVNACGDFTLLPRQAWESIRGYPELPIGPVHLDSLGYYNALALGLRQIILRDPLRIYHIDHGKSTVGFTLMDQYRRHALQPWLGWDTVQELRREMIRTRGPILFNDEEWGLAEETFEEQ